MQSNKSKLSLSTTALSMEKLITEVRKHPTIWNIHHSSYSDKKLKMKAWQSVCAVFYPDTVGFSVDETNKISFIQKKWKSVRDYYIKQRKEVQSDVGLSGHRRRKYVYFDMLRFLEANTEHRNSSNTLDNLETCSKREDKVEIAQENSLDVSEDLQENILIKVEEADDFHYHSDAETEEHIPVKRRHEIDEDEMFLLSLLPSIRQLTPLQKLDFKLEIMGVLKRIQFPEDYPK